MNEKNKIITKAEFERLKRLCGSIDAGDVSPNETVNEELRKVVYELIRWCNRGEIYLNSWEQDFILNMWAWKTPYSAKQRSKIVAMYAKYCSN